MSHDGSVTYAQRDRLVAVLAISIGIMVLELAGGIASNSLALVADAGHVLADAVGIGLALGAIWISRRPLSDERTFGYYRAEILAALLNALLLFGVAGFVFYEALRRLFEPPIVTSGLMLVVAVVGAAGNAASVWLLHRPQAQSLNMRGAYLEVMGDLIGSMAVVVAAVVIALTGARVADPAASIVVGVLIVPRTWGLLREAVDILMEATPRGMRLAEVRDHLARAAGVEDVHDLHVWTITRGMRVASAHVVLERSADPAAVLEELNQCLAEDFDVEHSTIQLETHDRRRYEEARHA